MEEDTERESGWISVRLAKVPHFSEYRTYAYPPTVLPLADREANAGVCRPTAKYSTGRCRDQCCRDVHYYPEHPIRCRLRSGERSEHLARHFRIRADSESGVLSDTSMSTAAFSLSRSSGYPRHPQNSALVELVELALATAIDCTLQRFSKTTLIDSPSPRSCACRSKASCFR